MKLRTKISAVAVGLLLIFSQIFSIGLLHVMQEKTVRTIVAYEQEKFQKIVQSFERSVEEAQKRQKLNDETARFVGKNLFQNNSYSGNSILYYKTEEIYNSSPYEFHLKRLEEKSGVKKITRFGEILEPKPLIEEAEGEKLLILSYRIEDFEIIYYKNISVIYENTRQLFVRGILGALLLSVCLLAVLQGSMRKIFQPLHRLEEAAESFEKGNYSERLTSLTKDEIGDISRSFNQMADRVEAHIQELGEKNERQQNLLGSLAHELKTPMTAILGYAQTLQRVSLPQEKQEKALAYIEQECKRLSRLSAKLLELTGLSNGEVTLEKRRLKVSELLERTEVIARYRLQKKGIQLKIEVREGLEILGDADLLLSFLVNLVDNACKACREQGTIHLIGKAEGIFVQDNGQGIAAEELEKITEPFYMVDKSRSRKEGGAGLGLALCRQIALLHGGILEIKSEEGRGTCAGLVTTCLQAGEDLDTQALL